VLLKCQGGQPRRATTLHRACDGIFPAGFVDDDAPARRHHAGSIALWLAARTVFDWNCPLPRRYWYSIRLLAGVSCSASWCALGGARSRALDYRGALHDFIFVRLARVRIVMTMAANSPEFGALVPASFFSLQSQRKTNLRAYRFVHFVGIVILVISSSEGPGRAAMEDVRSIVVCGKQSLAVFCVASSCPVSALPADG